MLPRVHLAIRYPPLQRKLRRCLATLEAAVDVLPNSADLRTATKNLSADVLIVRDGVFEGDIALLVEALRQHPDQPQLVVMQHGDDAEARSALAADGVRLVLGVDDAEELLKGALEELLLDIQQRGPRSEVALTPRPRQVAESDRMRSFMATVRRVLPVDTTVLIEGETGVGKERLARWIHEEGPRREGAFVAVNCGALPDALMESELFGHARGAFTDAVRDKRGKFELAHGGTLFLDEIGDMPLHLQVKLLRVLQEREVQRLGTEDSVAVDIRVIAATNVGLKAAAAESRFRSDLYYRLAVVTLTIPPLRERVEDIPRLVEQYASHYSTNLNKGELTVTPQAMAALCAYAWPGNVRELMNVVERAVLLCDPPLIGPDALPEELAVAPDDSAAVPEGLKAEAADSRFPAALLEQPFAAARDDVLAAFERWFVESILHSTGGRMGEAARRMGVNPRTLYEKLQRYGLDKRQFRG